MIAWFSVLHPHARATSWPTALRRQRSASDASTGTPSCGAQMQAGSQVWLPTETLRMKRQSEVSGPVPLETGWLQSPLAASAGAAEASEAMRSSDVAMRFMGGDFLRQAGLVQPNRRSASRMGGGE